MQRKMESKIQSALSSSEFTEMKRRFRSMERDLKRGRDWAKG